ncbi:MULTISPECIES: hypothetical protein [Rhodococcus]|uniref:Uncharacterized protein n=1 Tax=Rhodococcus qingshengii JCM 15477 TaxID=1303681 RepID=A0AB38RN41_RHOSG|nr:MULTISPECIES: hypothetical protein [Rhodococcus]UPU46169.1 hypothetical protein M0639_29890 [Rhodococcus qingshengii JCM 15477]
MLLRLLEFGVDAAGFGELVFEDDDAARGIECGAGGDEFVGACGDTQLIARVAAIPSAATSRCAGTGSAFPAMVLPAYEFDISSDAAGKFRAVLTKYCEASRMGSGVTRPDR